MTDFSKSLIDWQKWKCRCSSLSVLFTEPRSKAAKEAGELSETAKKHLYKAYLQAKWSREKDITTKQMDKGTLVEQQIIDILSFIDDKVYTKNTERKENEWIQGCPDIVADHIDDAKGAWDPESFAPHIMDDLGDDNFFQMQGYLWLFGKEKGYVSRVLVNCPDIILKNELQKLLYSMDVATSESTEYKIAAADLIRQLTYDDIPLSERIIRKGVRRDAVIIAEIPIKVTKARRFLEEMDKKHLQFQSGVPIFE